MLIRGSSRALAVCAAAVLFGAGQQAQTPGRRPVTHGDYDSFRAIQGQALSRDGRYLGYALLPQDGDGEVVIRNLATGEERREPVGAHPIAAPRNAEASPEERPPEPPGVRILFTGDSQGVVFNTWPSKAETAKARKQRRKAEEMPKSGIVIINLASGSVDRISGVKNYQVSEKAGGWVAYLKEAASTAAASPAPASAGDASVGGTEDQRGRGGAAGSGSAAGGPRPEFGTDLVLHRVADQVQRTFPDVTEYVVAKDGRTLIYAVSAHKAESNGAYAVALGNAGGAAQGLASGDGKYLRLTFDEDQRHLAFLMSPADRPSASADAKEPDAPRPRTSRIARYRLMLWNRDDAGGATLAVSPETAGFPDGMLINDRAPLTFSRDGRHVFFGYSRPAALRERPSGGGANTSGSQQSDDTRVDVDLWHWKDDFIQPMQKVRGETERRRSWRAVFHSDDRRLVALGGIDMDDVTPSENGLWALGGDTRAYRRIVEYDQRYSDLFFIDTRTGARKAALKKFAGGPAWSPDASAVLYYQDKNWYVMTVAEGKPVNLTGSLAVSFANEEHDTPSDTPPYGAAGWTKDGKSVLLYDRYDIWRIAADGSSSKLLTAGAGRREHIQFRTVRVDPEERWFDPAAPLLLRAENLDTYDTGFFRTRMDAPENTAPEKLLMGPRNFTPPLKARAADVYVLAASTFREFPDLLVTDSSMKDLRKVSNAAAQTEPFLWGSAELIRFRNVDGVPLKGVLYKPDNFDPHKKYPLMVYIYERLSSGLHRFVPPTPGTSINITYYVSNGYLVLLPDIAYVTGYPGQSALKAVLPAIQAVVDQGYVNEEAIGIQGHSWGGYQIAYMITQTNRFRAVAAGAPVANMISAYDGIRWGPGLPRQFQYEHTQSRIGGSLWEYPMRFVENSPIFWADRVRTPLMMLHNDGDDAVPWYQGIEYYLALRRLGREVYLFDYNGEPHGLRKRANQKDYTVRLQQYFDFYLKGAPKPAWMERGRPYVDRLEEELERERSNRSPSGTGDDDPEERN
jgi:dipeptidyl aminopeptidase/acylaminoacyl peptidase